MNARPFCMKRWLGLLCEGGLHHGHEFVSLMKLVDYVTPTDEFPSDENLRNGGPFGEDLDPFPNGRVIQNIDGGERMSQGLKHLYSGG